MRETMASLKEQLSMLRKEADISSSALHLVLTTKPDLYDRAVIRRDGAKEVYALKLYGARRAHGGILVIIFHTHGQSPMVAETSYFEHAVTCVRLNHALPLEYREAFERLAQRHKLLDTTTLLPSGKVLVAEEI